MPNDLSGCVYRRFKPFWRIQYKERVLQYSKIMGNLPAFLDKQQKKVLLPFLDVVI